MGVIADSATKEQTSRHNKTPKEAIRKGKFFFVSSTTTTSTLSTTTICWVSTNAAVNAVCPGRKKRSIQSIREWDDETVAIKSSSVLTEDPAEKKASTDLKSGLLEDEDKKREARFLLYWATSTSTTTSTSYTSTSTLASLICTPSSFTISMCG